VTDAGGMQRFAFRLQWLKEPATQTVVAVGCVNSKRTGTSCGPVLRPLSWFLLCFIFEVSSACLSLDLYARSLAVLTLSLELRSGYGGVSPIGKSNPGALVSGQALRKWGDRRLAPHSPTQCL
jgi:hypothetical protein